MRLQFKELGLYAKPTYRIISELLAFLVLATVSYVLLFLSNNVLMKCVWMMLNCLSSFGVASNTHTSSHHATSRSRNVDNLLTFFGYPLFSNISATYWRNKHVKIHHAFPNVLHVDRDAEPSPWFTFNRLVLTNRSGIVLLYYKVQWLFVPFALAFNFLNFVINGWCYVARKLMSHERRLIFLWDGLLLVLHVLLWLVLPLAFFPMDEVFLLIFLRYAIIGYLMFIFFAPAHFPEEAPFVKQAENGDFLLHVTTTTLNFKPGPVGRLISAGLEYQIEHHLFPTISHVHYPTVSKYLKAHCHKFGYPYRELSWYQAIIKSLKVFKNLKGVEQLNF